MFTLLLLFVIPFFSALLILIFPKTQGKMMKNVAFGLSLIPLIILIFINSNLLGADINYLWFAPLSIFFHLHVDTLSLVFLYLTVLVIPLSLMIVKSRSLDHPNAFYALVFLLEGLLIGFFTAQDLALFTIFWEAMLFPLYFIIAIWGKEQRHSAALKFLLYMIAGSVLMIVAVLSVYLASDNSTFDLEALAKNAVIAPYANWLFACFLLAFAVKTPLFPFHGWLPDAYCQAPTSGTILLSAILSKAGIYGILRVGMELFPTQMISWGSLMLGFAIAGVLYGSLAAWSQKDYKRLIAYSSFAHVNFILAGLFIWNVTAHEGAILQVVNHSLTITALFIVIYWLEERLKTTFMGHISGLANFLPKLCWLTLFFVLSSLALPGTNNFVGELLIFYGLFGQNPWLAALLGTSIILSAIYMLRLMQKIYFQSPNTTYESLSDIKGKEIVKVLPLIALILWIGIYPAPVLKQIEPAAKQSMMINKVEDTK